MQYKTSVNEWLKEPEKFSSPKAFMKKYLIEKNSEKCIKCGWNTTNQKTGKIPIEMHHKDGNWKNNNIKNLELLCPNCHSLTETYRIGNIGKGRDWVMYHYHKRKITITK